MWPSRFIIFCHSSHNIIIINHTQGGIKDWIVMSLVGAIVLLDTIPVLVLTAYEGGRTKAVLVQHVENPSDEEGVS